MRWEDIIGGNVRRLRRERRFSQEELAHRSGMSMRYLAGVERGEENPSLGFLVKLAEALDVKPGQLFDDNTGNAG